MRAIERGFEAAIFLSRWLLAPFLVGLVLTIFLLLFHFFGDFHQVAVRLPTSNWHQLIVGVLNMIDIVLTANLVLIVIFSGYENFLHRVEAHDHQNWPEGLTSIDFVALKQRVHGLDRRHRGGRCVGLVSRSGKKRRQREADMGRGVPAHVRRRHAHAGDCRPLVAQQSAAFVAAPAMRRV